MPIGTQTRFVCTPLQTAIAGCGSIHLLDDKRNTYLPSDQKLTDGLELRLRKPLGENVRLLLGGADVLGNNPVLLTNVGAEEMVLQGQVLVAGGHLGDIDKRGSLGCPRRR